MEAPSIFQSLKELGNIISDEKKRHLIEGYIAIYAFSTSRTAEKNSYYYNSSSYAAKANELQIIKQGLDATCKKLKEMTVDKRIAEVFNALNAGPLNSYINEVQYRCTRPLAFVSRIMFNGFEDDRATKIGELVENAVKSLYEKKILEKAIRLSRYENITKTEYDAITAALREYYESIEDSIKSAKPSV